MIAAWAPAVVWISVEGRVVPGGCRRVIAGTQSKGGKMFLAELKNSMVEVQMAKGSDCRIYEWCECDACIRRRAADLTCALQRKFGYGLLATSRGEK
jgi:hypothetical protein